LLIGYDTYAETTDVRKAANDVLRVIALHLIELPVVDHARDHVVHVVRLVRVVRNDVEQRLFAPGSWVGARPPRRVAEIVRRNEAKEIENVLEALRLRVARD